MVDRTSVRQSTYDARFYSLEELFSLSPEETKDNVYEVIHQVSFKNQQIFKYVQFRREAIETKFSKHEVLQIIDISEKILYEMAVGEKRMFSIINATVSHDMRNPTNSIQA